MTRPPLPGSATAFTPFSVPSLAHFFLFPHLTLCSFLTPLPCLPFGSSLILTYFHLLLSGCYVVPHTPSSASPPTTYQTLHRFTSPLTYSHPSGYLPPAPLLASLISTSSYFLATTLFLKPLLLVSLMFLTTPFTYLPLPLPCPATPSLTPFLFLPSTHYHSLLHLFTTPFASRLLLCLSRRQEVCDQPPETSNSGTKVG